MRIEKGGYFTAQHCPERKVIQMESTMKLQKESASAEKNRKRAEKRQELGLPHYSLGEEIFSAVSHGVSALFAVAALVLLLVFCEKTAINLVTVSIYGGTMVLLYTVSTIYHGLGLNRAKKVFRVLDHCTIFLLIAGTYAPITLACIRGTLGWVLFGVVWGAAVLGVVLNAVSLERFKVLSMVCYLAMGWVVVFAMQDFVRNSNAVAFATLLAGGICYTVGAVLYGVGKKIPYMHSVFHLFVLAGSVLHTVCVYQIVK